MFRPLLLAVLVLAPTASLAADEPTPGTASESQPSARRAQRLTWEKQTIIDAYDAAGHRDPKWDEPARRALQAHMAMRVEGIGRTGDEEDVSWQAGHAALQEGCKDGLVLYVVARGWALRTDDPATMAREHQASAEAIRGSKYPAFRKVLSFLRAATYTAALGQPDAAQKARGYADEALALMPEVFADKQIPVAALTEVLDILTQAGGAYGGDLGAMGDKALAALEASPQPKSAVLTAKGDFLVHIAWAARGYGFADTVTPEGQKMFERGLAVARANLEEACKADPSDAEASAALISVEMGSGRGDRPAMERWYERAMKADPSCRDAAVAKMAWLEPKWHGDRDAMLAFGRELLAGGNWDAGLPLLLADAHWTLACYGKGGLLAVPDPAYFANNPAAWADVKAVYEPYLKKVPGSRFHRTRYALIAAWCGQWAEANRQFTELGPSYSRRVVPAAVYGQAFQQALAAPGDAANGNPPDATKAGGNDTLPF